jgi:hypothetical protein
LPNLPFARAAEQLNSYADKPWFARLMIVMTVAIGAIGVVETAIRGVLIFSLPTDRAVLLTPVVRYSAAGLILILAFGYFAPAVRRGEREDGRGRSRDASSATLRE